mmetsp:Transcript_7040/g.16649  ORF Transcript_7040/g.16649 Transcript_7040/m.16649 type:complete len:235 (+) Transcript_7040:470-1174(+)
MPLSARCRCATPCSRTRTSGCVPPCWNSLTIQTSASAHWCGHSTRMPLAFSRACYGSCGAAGAGSHDFRLGSWVCLQTGGVKASVRVLRLLGDNRLSSAPLTRRWQTSRHRAAVALWVPSCVHSSRRLPSVTCQSCRRAFGGSCSWPLSQQPRRSLQTRVPRARVQLRESPGHHHWAALAVPSLRRERAQRTWRRLQLLLPPTQRRALRLPQCQTTPARHHLCNCRAQGLWRQP